MGAINDFVTNRRKRRELNIARLDKKLQQERARAELARRTSDLVTNTGYSHGGASKSATWAKKYNSTSYSSKRDIEENRTTLRERSRDLAMNSPLAAAAIGTMRTSTVGAGLMPKPKIDYEFLRISKEEAENLERDILKEFSLWAEKTFCDAADLNNFYELQQIAFNDLMRNGKAFALIKYEDALPYMPYQLKIKLIEADKICSPNSFSGDYSGLDEKLENGSRIMNGIEITADGKVEAYYISSTFPKEFETGQKWTRVKKRGKLTGNPNILHVFSAERAEQYRGVPFLAPVISSIKQITRYTEAEIMAALVSSLFTVFITTETGNDIAGYDGEEEESNASGYGVSDDDDVMSLGSGTILQLKTGEGVQTVAPSHPSGNYESFMTAMSTHVGAALGIAPEALLKKFTNNYSASKGALNETWKAVKTWRKWFVRDFCQEIYELWFNEAVSKGRIKAAGYFTDPLIKSAYTNATWNGPAQGYMNPLAEVNAAIARIEAGLSTHEDECAMLNGSNFSDNVRTLENENEKLKKANGDTIDNQTDKVEKP